MHIDRAAADPRTYLPGRASSSFLCLALFHSLIGRPQDFDVGGTKRKLTRLNGGGAGFDFVYPIEELTHRRLIAARGLSSELHHCCLYLRNLSSFPTHRRGDLVASGLHEVSAEVFGALGPALWITGRALAKLRVLGRVTAANFLCGAAYLFSLFGHGVSPCTVCFLNLQNRV